MATDPRLRFAATADDYNRHRPTYPAALAEWVLEEARVGTGATIADVGCGTGISSRLFAAPGFDVIGIDPSEEMLAHARAAGGARYQRGEASATGLPERSVDIVIAGQAFHWFDLASSLAEFRRILRPGGFCTAFWNLRARTPFLDAYDALLCEHSVEYAGVPKAEAAMLAIRESPEVVALREAEFRHAQLLDREGLLGRARSSSYVAHGVRDREAFERALGALWSGHQSAGRVEFAYRTVALLWQLSSARP